jgi:hypothetical protein
MPDRNRKTLLKLTVKFDDQFPNIAQTNSLRYKAGWCVLSLAFPQKPPSNNRAQRSILRRAYEHYCLKTNIISFSFRS